MSRRKSNLAAAGTFAAPLSGDAIDLLREWHSNIAHRAPGDSAWRIGDDLPRWAEMRERVTAYRDGVVAILAALVAALDGPLPSEDFDRAVTAFDVAFAGGDRELDAAAYALRQSGNGLGSLLAGSTEAMRAAREALDGKRLEVTP